MATDYNEINKHLRQITRHLRALRDEFSDLAFDRSIDDDAVKRVWLAYTAEGFSHAADALAKANIRMATTLQLPHINEDEANA